MRIIHRRQEEVLGCRVFPEDKDPASEHDVSELGQHTIMASTLASYAESHVWPRRFPSCKGCYPYPSIYEHGVVRMLRINVT